MMRHCLMILTAWSACLPWLTPVSGEFTPVAGWDNQLFPAYLIATATVKADSTAADENTLGDVHGQLGVLVTATEDDQRIKVTIACEDFLESSEWNGRLPNAGQTYAVHPKIRYRFDRLSKCLQATPATVTFRVQQGDQPVEETSATVTFRPVNDCPIKVAIGDEVVDTKFTFAAFVNEQHPFVDKLLREALDLGVVDKFDGYQAGTPEEVVRQVYAIWDLLVARDVRYSSITTTAADSDQIASQHVRMIEETANNSQANCVDGSVLMVSMLRKIGINAALVLEPGHCYIAFAADPEGKLTIGLETTLMGSEAEEPDDVPALLEEAVSEDLRGERSWPSFLHAVLHGDAQLEKNKDKLESSSDADYAFIDVRVWRSMGVLPIPFSGREKFVAYDHSEYLSEQEGTSEEDEGSEEDESETP